MNNQKKPSIVVSDIRRFYEFSYIQSVLDKEYNGEMPLSMYEAFLKVISNPELKAYFVRNFKPSSLFPDRPNLITPKKRRKKKKKATVVEVNSIVDKTASPIRSTYVVKKTTTKRHKSVYIVKATDFSCQHTLTGQYLVFRTHKTFCIAESKWFRPHVLKSIDRTFKIQLSDYVGFTFIPYSDKQVFIDLLEQAYLDVEQQIYKKHLTHCLKSIEKYVNNCFNTHIQNFQNIKFETSIDKYYFNVDKQVYIYKFNALEHFDIKEGSVNIHVPLTKILEQLNEVDRNKYHNEITSKYPDGYHTVADLDTIFPNHTSLNITIIIPKIFIMRFGKDKPIGIKAEYLSDLGHFKAGISSNIPGSQYQTDTFSVILSDDIKKSLINIMRNINSRFIITFYTAFIRMFNEGDSIVQSNYEKQLELLNKEKEDYDYYRSLTWAEHNRYNSGYSPLLYFDTNNSSDWMWLTVQMKNRVFLNAYSFKDKDETLSSKYGETVKYPVKVYLTVKDASYTYNNYLNQSIHVDRIIISMYALDTTKSIYRFEVERNKTNEAIFYIWSYFSSNNYNKRQDFEYILGLKHLFGINFFYKDKPLDYHSGIGYCDRKWHNDVK